MLVHGITTLKDLLNFKGTIKGMSQQSIEKYQSMVESTFPYNKPASLSVDFKKADNPYKVRNPNDWEMEIKKVSHMSSYVCITDLISFMFAESKRLMNGTKFENNWYFYHDALSLMKAKDAKEWMRKEGILDKWILPLNELNKGTSFAGHPVGNSPELMPLDCSLFNDVNQSVNYHINITRNLSEEDDKKFSMSSMKRGVSAYLRILEPTIDPNAGCPSSKRICEDCSKWTVHLSIIKDHNGCAVPGLGDQNDKRKLGMALMNKRGGARVKGQGKSRINTPNHRWLHPDAIKSLKKIKYEASNSLKSNL